MQDYSTIAHTLRDILELEREPVAVKLVRKDEDLDSLDLSSYDATTKSRFCQAVMRASEGEKTLLNAANISCAAAAAALGLKSLHPKLESGKAHHSVGTYGTVEAAQKIMAEMPRLASGDCISVLTSPLSDCAFEPDIVVVEAAPENLMWLALASIYTSGERLQFSTSVVQAACVDSTVIPFVTGKLNFSLGCTGCREATDLKRSESVMGIPVGILPTIMQNLQDMQEVIIHNRKKSIFQRFAEKQEQG